MVLDTFTDTPEKWVNTLEITHFTRNKLILLVVLLLIISCSFMLTTTETLHELND